MASRATHLRQVGGLAVLAIFALVLATLLPHYWRNYRYQNSLDLLAREALERAAPAEWLVQGALQEAARYGLPIQPETIRVRRSHRWVEITAIYTVPVKLPLYTVDLHFRPRGRAP